MKIKEIRGMDKESLNTKLSDLKKELIKINAQVAIGTTPKSPGQVKAIKKIIAKILTVIKEMSETQSVSAHAQKSKIRGNQRFPVSLRNSKNFKEISDKPKIEKKEVEKKA